MNFAVKGVIKARAVRSVRWTYKARDSYDQCCGMLEREGSSACSFRDRRKASWRRGMLQRSEREKDLSGNERGPTEGKRVNESKTQCSVCSAMD